MLLTTSIFLASLFPALNHVTAQSIEPSGRLWVAFSSNSGLTAFARNYDLSANRLAATTFYTDQDSFTRPNIRGMAYDPTDGNVWVTFLLADQAQSPGPGDGVIHKKPASGTGDLATIPGTNGSLFHSKPGQDDSRADHLVKYFHFYGQRLHKTTIGRVIATTEKHCDSAGANCTSIATFKTDLIFGDGTVPVLSAERRSNGLDLNAEGATLRKFQALPREEDDHTGLTRSAEVHKEIFKLLNIPQQSSTSSATTQEREQGTSSVSVDTEKRIRPDIGIIEPPVPPIYFLNVTGVDYITVEDEFGNSNRPIGETLFRGDVPGVDFHTIGEKSYEVIMPGDSTFTLTFKAGTSPLFIELIKAVSKDTPSQAIRYRDLNLPAGVNALLTLTANGVENLRYDSDGDGTFETVVQPTASATGALALDVDPPTITISGTYQQNTALVTLTAQDNISGVKNMRYSFDGAHYQFYSSTFTVNLAQAHTLYVFADDNMANRSVEDTFELTPVLTPASQDFAY